MREGSSSCNAGEGGPFKGQMWPDTHPGAVDKITLKIRKDASLVAQTIRNATRANRFARIIRTNHSQFKNPYF